MLTRPNIEEIMVCTHHIVERDTAISDGYCPLCQAAEINKLRAALEPFAKMADQVDAWQKSSGGFDGAFDANDLRRARELLAEYQ